MPRPTTKQQLLDAMQKEHAALEQQLDDLTSEQIGHTSDDIEHWGPRTFWRT